MNTCSVQNTRSVPLADDAARQISAALASVTPRYIVVWDDGHVRRVLRWGLTLAEARATSAEYGRRSLGGGEYRVMRHGVGGLAMVVAG